MKNSKHAFSIVRTSAGSLVLVIGLLLPYMAGATIYQPGETLAPDCAPGSVNCGVTIFSLNGQTNAVQTLVTGATGTDFSISSNGNIHTFNLPSASALNRGLLTALDWSTFNSKQAALGYTPLNPANNLSDLVSVSVARTNLGLGTLATQNGIFSGTSSGTNTGDQTTITGNAGTATALQTDRTINGITFDGTADITVPAAAGTLAGNTLTSNVTASSLTSFGTVSSLTLSGAITGATGFNGLVITPNTGIVTSGTWNGTTVAVANGGTGTTNGSITGTGALSFTSNTINALTLDSGTNGAINIGNNANVKTITIGNTTGATALTLNAGTGAISIGTGAQARAINIGTGAAVQTIAVGSTSGASSLTLDSGTGAVNLGTSNNAKIINIGTGTAGNTMNIGTNNTTADTIGIGSILDTATIAAGTFNIANPGGQLNGSTTLCINANRVRIGASSTSCNTSSSRFKHDIKRLHEGLETINALRPVHYVYNDMNTYHLGLIAEDVYPFIPTAVVLDAQGLPFALDYNEITPVIINAIQEQSAYLGDVTPKVNADGSDNGLSTLVATIQSETTHNPVAIVAKKISTGKRFLTDFVAARVTAIRGYFDQVFAKKVHTEQLCISQSNGAEVCVTGDQLHSLLENAKEAPVIRTVPSASGSANDTAAPTSPDAPPPSEKATVPPEPIPIAE